MKFDLDELNPGSWFDIEDARICIRVCAGKDLEKIHKKTRKRQIEYRRGQRFEWDEMKKDKDGTDMETKLVNDFIIVDWENICDANGVVLECNNANKNKLILGSPMFAGFLAGCLEELNINISQTKEEEEKNLLSG